MERETVIFEKLIWSWIRILSEIAPYFFPRLERGSPLLKELMYDFNQFIALAEHLEMRLSVSPCGAWGQFQWNLDFRIFLNQLIRRSYYCLSHLIALFDGRCSYS